ncbi:hypothetical protein C7M61_003695 [Candidozyma pseudohaemuli]|uniref:BRCT domain-containing protein n=1 Tax=Candidozyma pseudohaemuli TaxID=418784 RepID=A0A2P7YLI2_9ASCO|nr:hypothetical protein C7M61_003695 [[Candida] pseudohaemulonii]PSK36831.1 hypothetical protein C7M61_003695 [[Candida] pseudohaemulonii]
MSALFEETNFLIIDSHSKDNEISLSTIKEIISRNGGKSVPLTPESSLDDMSKNNISHIITWDYDFTGLSRAQDLMLPITSPQWLQDSELASQRKNYRLYSPRPLPFMDKVVVCIADNLPEGDKEMMYAGVRAFGGQYLDSLSRYTTHLIANDLSNNKSVLAANIKQRENLKIQIVLPHWLDDCFREQKCLDEKPYRLSDPVTLRTGKPNFEIRGTVADSIFDDEASSASQPNDASDVLQGKHVYLAPDHSFSEHFRESIHELIQLHGGVVMKEFDPSQLNVYVGKFREGSEYQQCVDSGHVEVASLRWLYQVVVRRQYITPLSSNLLNFPIPKTHVPELSGARISVTGYSGDARHYLSQLISIMGALFTKTLDSQNNYLVAEKHRGEKYMAVRSRWPDVKIVNHLWIEHCFAKWKYIDPAKSIYQKVNEETPKLGTAIIDDTLLGTSSRKETSLNIDDSTTDVLDARSETGEKIENIALASDEQKASSEGGDHLSLPSEDVEVTGAQYSTAGSVSQKSEQPKETVGSRLSRSAKQKATSKLHSDMEDLNNYASILKSTRKMNSYMKDLESSIEANKKRSANSPDDHSEIELNSNGQDSPRSGTPLAKKRRKLEVLEQTAIMTGCEAELTLNRADVVKLARIGLKIVNDYESQRKVDLLVAPKVLRTEKFLKSLSQCNSIVHPHYLSDLLDSIQLNPDKSPDEILALHLIEKYYLDAVVPVKQINEDLGVSAKESGLTHLLNSSNKGSVFQDLRLNLSANLNGGPDLIASILKEHGVQETKKVKVSMNVKKNSLLANANGEVILIAHKEKDKRSSRTLNAEGVIIVEWDWCVKSIFKLKLDEYPDYLISFD